MGAKIWIVAEKSSNEFGLETGRQVLPRFAAGFSRQDMLESTKGFSMGLLTCAKE
jgi:hypothetical protein